MTYHVVSLDELCDRNADDVPAALQAALEAHEVEGWTLVSVVPEYDAAGRDAASASRAGPYFVLHRAELNTRMGNMR